MKSHLLFLREYTQKTKVLKCKSYWAHEDILRVHNVDKVMWYWMDCHERTTKMMAVLVCVIQKELRGIRFTAIETCCYTLDDGWENGVGVDCQRTCAVLGSLPHRP